ncbi:fucose-binding lectin II [Lactobacillus helveticus]|uniref:fucose-binding lectin II n=1 Tax=Lactobacillus helveticus TaxID=1587 RepID=UPI002182239F|nr:fucose-binding lectin II [Lactobacillus helveticus]MCT0197862.1 fucose-binding lectin II [Lactobacillus helveticus]
MNKYIKSVLTSATLVIAALTLSTTTNAASIRKASTGTIHSRIARTYSYAKKMIKENKTELSGQSSSIFSKKLNPDTGATAGYSDFLLGLKGNGYKFNTKEKTLLRKNLVIKKTTSAATMANAVMAVQAMGLNARDYKPYGHKKGINLVTKLYRTSVSKQTTSVQAQVLIAISMSSKFKQPKGAKFSKASLSARLVKAQLNNHGWTYNNQQGVRDADTTSMVLTGLARGKVNTTNVKDSLLKGQKFLTGIVQPSGAFGYTFNGKTTPNANSTAEAIIALSNDFGMKKYVNNTTMKTSQTRTPLYAMLTYVNKSGSIKNAATQLYGVGQVNLAVAAYKAALKNRSVYTIN